MNFRELVFLLLPLILIPLTLYAVKSFGHVAGDVIIGAVFFIGIVKFASGSERRFMVILMIFSSLFESINVASGSYKYLGVVWVPLWVGLGWGILGLHLFKNRKLFGKLPPKAAYALACVLYFATWAYSGFAILGLIPAIFAVLGVYVLSLSAKLPPSFFLASGFLGVLIEFSGTNLGIWQYFDEAGMPIAAPLSILGLAYASVVTFVLWLSGLD
jgi:hypothetical protein